MVKLEGDSVTAVELFIKVRSMSNRGPDIEWKHLMALVADLPLAYRRWSHSSENFSFKGR